MIRLAFEPHVRKNISRFTIKTIRVKPFPRPPPVELLPIIPSNRLVCQPPVSLGDLFYMLPTLISL